MAKRIIFDCYDRKMCRGIIQSNRSPGADEDAEDEPASPAVVLSDLEKDWCYECMLVVTANINTKQA